MSERKIHVLTFLCRKNFSGYASFNQNRLETNNFENNVSNDNNQRQGFLHQWTSMYVDCLYSQTVFYFID